MRSLLFVVLGFALAGVAGCSDSAEYDCQPICKNSAGLDVGGNSSYTVEASSESDADKTCLQDALTDSSACPTGDTVDRCSCDVD